MSLFTRVAGLATTAALALTALTGTSAQAVGESITATTTTAVAGDNCIEHPVTYNITLPAGAVDWSATLEMVYPAGHTGSVRKTMAPFLGYAQSGTITMQICGGVEPLGTWTLQPTLSTYRDAANKTHYVDLKGAPTSFEVVGQAKSKASLKLKKKGKKVSARSVLTVSTGATKAPVAAQQVLFQKKAGKKWKTVAKATTSDTGLAKAKFKAARGTTVRAHFKGAGYVTVGSAGMSIPAATSKAARVR